MRDIFIVIWVVMIQFMACYMAYWLMSVTLFILLVNILWQGVFAYVNYRVRKSCRNKGNDVSILTYLALSLPAYFFPMFSSLIFGGLSIYRVIKIAGITVGDSPLKDYFSFEQEYVYKNSDNTSFSERTNPSTGLVMNGAVDIAGNAYGSSSHNYYR